LHDHYMPHHIIQKRKLLQEAQIIFDDVQMKVLNDLNRNRFIPLMFSVRQPKKK
jgi:hypothetical protein